MKSEKHVGCYVESVIDLIGDTPLISLKKSTGYNIFAKAEFLNPGGSIKDRIALGMLRDAEEKGLLKKGMTIIEPTVATPESGWRSAVPGWATG